MIHDTAEKSLKASLAYHERHIEKTHDIEYLLGLCSEILPEIEKLIEPSRDLTAYAVESRYPVPRVEVTELQAKQAIETVRTIYEFVLNSLPDLAEN